MQRAEFEALLPGYFRLRIELGLARAHAELGSQSVAERGRRLTYYD
jgi:hypothetical protein